MIQLSVKWFQRLKGENILTSLTLSVPHLYRIKNKPCWRNTLRSRPLQNLMFEQRDSALGNDYLT